MNTGHLLELIEVKEVGVRYANLTPVKKRIKIMRSNDAYEVFIASMERDNHDIDLQEAMYVIVLNRANQVLGCPLLSLGAMTGVMCDPKLVFIKTLELGGCKIILGHNHPSGGTRPSYADDKMTEKIKEGAKLLEIELLDHLVVTTEGYYSYADESTIL